MYLFCSNSSVTRFSVVTVHSIVWIRPFERFATIVVPDVVVLAESLCYCPTHSAIPVVSRRHAEGRWRSVPWASEKKTCETAWWFAFCVG